MTRLKDTRSGARRRARECALEILFQLDPELTAGRIAAVDAEIARYFAVLRPDQREEDSTEPLEAESVDYASHVVRGVAGHIASIDGALQRASQHWKLDRMARVDRNLLRLATFELVHATDVPVPVALNEAIEIAKRYGTGESSAFVNGILDRIAQGVPSRS